MPPRELPFIRDMFDAIAPWYDFLNRLLSMRQDQRWRRALVAIVHADTCEHLVDVACGTGDVAVEAASAGAGIVHGIDFSAGMLRLYRKKVIKKQLDRQLSCSRGDALNLGVKDACADAVTIAFGIRNITARSTAVREFYRVLKPGGRLGILELTTPTTGWFRSVYLFYFLKVLPGVGRLFSRHASAYHYLPESVLNFPEAPAFARILTAEGFTDIQWKPMTLGIVTLFIGVKPAP